MKTETVEGVYLLRGDGQTGPHTMDEVRSLLAQGWYNLQSLAWWEGAPGWVPLSQLPGLVPASSRPAPQRRTPVPRPPPPPPFKQPTYTLPECYNDDLPAFWGKFGAALLLPLLGLIIIPAFAWGWPFGLLGLVGVLFVFLGNYNAILSIKAVQGSVLKMPAACLAVAANAFYVLMALGAFISLGQSNSSVLSHGEARGASGAATLAAWRDYNAALMGLARSHMNSVQLEQAMAKLSGINARHVDPDLMAHIGEAGSLLRDAHSLASSFESELSTIQSNTQSGGLALGMLFGAIAAESGASDPYGDAFRAGQAAGELANEAGNIAVLQLQMKYMPKVEALESRRLRLHQNEQRLRKQLASFYGGGF